MKNIYLYTPWCEQGLSYDAKVIEEICSNNVGYTAKFLKTMLLKKFKKIA